MTKTISPPTIKQEPLDDPNQSMVPDSSSDLHSNPRHNVRKTTAYSHHRVKTEFEVKQEPNWDGEVSTFLKTFEIFKLKLDIWILSLDIGMVTNLFR